MLHGLTHIPKKMGNSAAIRQRLYLERKAEDLCVPPALVPKTRIVEVLLATGFLTTDEPTREQLAEAFSKWAFAHMTRQESELWPVP
jgi:hypothetical protein